MFISTVNKKKAEETECEEWHFEKGVLGKILC